MKNGYNRGGYREQQQPQQEDSFFEDSYGFNSINANNDFWVKCDEGDRFDSSEVAFQGRLHQKSIKTKKWSPYHFELYSDRLIRMTLIQPSTATTTTAAAATSTGNTSANTTTTTAAATTATTASGAQTGATFCEGERSSAEYLPLNACYLKKIKYSDTSYSNYKFGIRLQKGDLKSELFTDSAESFNKLYEEIKRFCILPKFAKKYKVLSKFKSSSSSNQQQPTSSASSNSASTSHLYKCFRFSDSTQYCVRIIDKYTLSETSRFSMLKETAILRKVDHPSIVKLYEVYEDEQSIFLVYELFQGKDLKSKMNDLLCMDEKSVSDFVWKLLHGLQHLHTRNIMHRDIRLENIFFRTPNNFNDICISNFAFADFVEYSKTVPGGMSPVYAFVPVKSSNNRKHGTAGYIAPELLRTKTIGDAKVDVFALGVIFYYLVFGRMPFEGKDFEETMKLNERCEIDYETPPFFSTKFSSSAFDLMKKMLEKEPKLRGDAATLLNHTWFVNMRNRGEDSKLHANSNNNNGYDFPTLSTVQEHTEGAELVSACVLDSRIFRDYDLKDSRSKMQLTLFDSMGQSINMNGNANFHLRKKTSTKDESQVAYDIDGNEIGVIIDEFSELKADQETISNNYVFNIVQDGSLIYEDEFVRETLSDKMIGLNKIQFIKVPSKHRHDSFHRHLQDRLGINIHQFYKASKITEPGSTAISSDQ